MENGKTLEIRGERQFDDSLREAFGDSKLFSLGENRGIVGDDDRYISDNNVVLGSEIAGNGGVMEVVEGGNTVVCVDKMAGGDENCLNIGINSEEKGDIVKVVEGENIAVCVERMSGGKENCSNICESETFFSVDSYMDKETEMQVNDTGSSYDKRSSLVAQKNLEARIDGADVSQQTGKSLFGNKGEDYEIEKTVETEGKKEENFIQSNETVEKGYAMEVVEGENKSVCADKVTECKENCSNIGETENVFLVNSYTGRDTEIHVYDTGSPVEGKRREISINGAERVQNIAMGLFGSKSEEFGFEKTVGNEGKEEDKHMRSNETVPTAIVEEDSMNTCEKEQENMGNLFEGNKSEELGTEKAVENKGKEKDIFMCSKESDSFAKAEEESLNSSVKQKENMGNLFEGGMNAVEEETPSVKLAFNSSKRKRRCKTLVENGSDEAKSLDLAFSEKDYQTRERKRSKYLSPPYYTDGFLEFLPKDSKISKVSYDRMSGEKPSKQPAVPSNHFEVINVSSPELLSELQMVALDSHYPNEIKYFDSIKVFFSKFRESVYHDESNIGICSKNTIDQSDVLDSSIADHNTDSSDISSAEVIPEPKRRNTKGKSIEISSINTIDLIDVEDSPVSDLKTETSRFPSPKVKAEPKRRNTKRKIDEGKSEPKKRNRKRRTKLTTLGNSATVSADIAKSNNVKPFSLVVDLHIDPKLSNVGRESPDPVNKNTDVGTDILESKNTDLGIDILESKNTDLGTDILESENTDLGTDMLDVNGNSVLPEKQKIPAEVGNPECKKRVRKEKLPSEDKPERKKRARKEKPPSQGKQERKKRVKKVEAVADLEKSTDEQNLNGNEAEPILLGKDSSEAKPEKKKSNPGDDGMLPLSIVKQNLEIMKSMIDKSGDKVSADMKAKLIDRIECLIEKVNTRDGSSSS